MRPVKRIWWALFLAMPFLILNAGNASANTDDVETPDVTARVARISFLSGDVQIKRADQTDWERATGNLPVVEGDEIATEANARLEIQFNSESFLRLSGNAYLKITTLRDEGIAVSLPNGSLSLRVLNFDKDRAYFEIDAPRTTVSVEKAGMYRVDAGDKNAAEIRIAVTEFGQARVYSENSGFTVKNGRSATIRIEGDYAGEWETADAAKFADDFDSWVLQRDAIIAKRLQKADYDKYYDRDFYGAEDLNEYGEWIYTKKYGYVWRPYRDSVSSYADWSPYRYGQWRWVPPYGWTWVNDEPWGWATYHHGRWVHDGGYWSWSPYPQTRGRRSWWRPALVVISYVANNICWYPLPHHYGYYNYNRYYVDRRRYNTTIINNTTVVVNPTPNPTPAAANLPTVGINSHKMKRIPLPAETVPADGVVTVAASDFGRNKGNFRPAGANLAIKVLSETPSETVRPATLPTFKDLNGRVSREILAENPRSVRPAAQIKTGAVERTEGVSMGENLRRTRILGGRPPVENAPPTDNNGIESPTPVRGTGAVRRQPRVETLPGDETPVRPSPRNNGGQIREPIRSTDSDDEREIRVQPPSRTRRDRDSQENSPPVENSPPRPERLEPPRRNRPEPVRPPEPPREERRVEPPRRLEPRREEPRREEPARPSPPAPRREPPAEQKVAPPSEDKPERDQR